MNKEFHFAVGKPWIEKDPKLYSNTDSNNICFYTYGHEIQWGTLKDAQQFKEYVERQTGEKEYIYIITPLEQDTSEQ